MHSHVRRAVKKVAQSVLCDTSLTSVSDVM